MKQFKTESKRILDLMIHSIYTNKEVFLRELISNASDAMDKRYYQSLTEKKESLNPSDLKIQLFPNKEERTLIIEDQGLGMSVDELDKDLGTIAKSGSLDFKKEIEEPNDHIDIIGQFGVGFYSAFIVSQDVQVISKKVGEEVAHVWHSTGENGYSIKESSLDHFGTKIILKLKDNTEEENYDEFLEEYTLEHLVKKYSDYVRYPIQMEKTHSIPDPTDSEKTISTKEWETLNSQIPLWKKNKKEISEEEYHSFYQSKFNDFNKPARVIHYQVEGTISYSALLFIPSIAPYNYYYQEYQPGLQLYSKGVFILDKAKDLLPESYRFVQGIIDCDDLSLNISREILQQDHQVRALAKSIEKKIHSALEDFMKEDRSNYEKFFDHFGLTLKFGILQNYGMKKKELQDFLLFQTNQHEYTSLQEYINRMKEDQQAIYYAAGKSQKEIQVLPVMKKLEEKGLEVLYLLDERDEFVLNFIHSYADKEFISITKADLDLDSEEEKKEKEKLSQDNQDLLSKMKKCLKDQVKEVRISSRLVDQPVCLVAEEGVSLEMEQYLAKDPMAKDMSPKATKILEINPKHPVFKQLQSLSEDHLSTYTSLLYHQALLLQGLPIEDPAEFSEELSKLMLEK
ncbi:molecular chaperone HtpG [Bulleidia extructa]|uniref:molecular chaperone HtpG n=1 Tax=Bulleidia extructa TaxID=118748 RepID=UPI002353BB10|nr:molecular chaperone HtpG [Bulleidia extructa]